MPKLALLCALFSVLVAAVVRAQDGADDTAAQKEFQEKLAALDWVEGPKSVNISKNSSLALPEGYVFLDAANTAKFDELTQNLGSGEEAMLAPKSLEWRAYLVFEEEGYVKDDEKVDAPAILKSLQEGAEDSNSER